MIAAVIISIWPRDLVQCATALLALGAEHEARDTLRYLIATQKQDGTGTKINGSTVRLIGGAYSSTRPRSRFCWRRAWPSAKHSMVSPSPIWFAGPFVSLRQRAVDPQDRWEENAGINPFTLTICIAALVAGAEFLPAGAKDFALALADFWNSRIESWMAVGITPLAQRLAVKLLHRLAPVEVLGDPGSLNSTLYLKNRKSGATSGR